MSNRNFQIGMGRVVRHYSSHAGIRVLDNVMALDTEGREAEVREGPPLSLTPEEDLREADTNLELELTQGRETHPCIIKDCTQDAFIEYPSKDQELLNCPTHGRVGVRLAGAKDFNPLTEKKPDTQLETPITHYGTLTSGAALGLVSQIASAHSAVAGMGNAARNAASSLQPLASQAGFGTLSVSGALNKTQAKELLNNWRNYCRRAGLGRKPSWYR